MLAALDPVPRRLRIPYRRMPVTHRLPHTVPPCTHGFPRNCMQCNLVPHSFQPSAPGARCIRPTIPPGARSIRPTIPPGACSILPTMLPDACSIQPTVPQAPTALARTPAASNPLHARYPQFAAQRVTWLPGMTPLAYHVSSSDTPTTCSVSDTHVKRP